MHGQGGDAAVAQALLAAAQHFGFTRARVGLADSCIAAAAATRTLGSSWRVVPPGRDREFLVRQPLSLLPVLPDLPEQWALLGLCSCGELARLPAAEVELRWGAEGLWAWRLAQGDDPRWPFRPPPAGQVSADVEFDPPVETAGPLRFVLPGLVTSVAAQLALRQRIPAALRLVLRLAGAPPVSIEVRMARPTADSRMWAEQCRLALDGMGTLDRPIEGVLLEGLQEGVARADQLDAFLPAAPDPAALQGALGTLLARWGDSALSRAVLHGAHLPGEHAAWEPHGARALKLFAEPRPVLSRSGPTTPDLALCLRRFPAPVAVRVTEDPSGRPLALDIQNSRSLQAEGPERISGAWWSERFAREYWIAEDPDGRVWLLFRDAQSATWFQEGWYD